MLKPDAVCGKDTIDCSEEDDGTKMPVADDWLRFISNQEDVNPKSKAKFRPQPLLMAPSWALVTLISGHQSF